MSNRIAFHFIFSIAHVWYEYLISNWTWNCQSSLIENWRTQLGSKHYLLISCFCLCFRRPTTKKTQVQAKRPPLARGVMTENRLRNVVPLFLEEGMLAVAVRWTNITMVFTLWVVMSRYHNLSSCPSGMFVGDGPIGGPVIMMHQYTYIIYYI